MVVLVRNEEALQTAAVAAELVALEGVAQGLVATLTRIQTSVGDSGKQRRLTQFFYQLAHGSRDEADLHAAMEDLGRAKADLGLCISVAHVGLSRGLQDTLVLNTRLLERVDSAVRAVVGDDQGLLIGKLARGRPVRGTLPYLPSLPTYHILAPLSFFSFFFPFPLSISFANPRFRGWDRSCHGGRPRNPSSRPRWSFPPRNGSRW